MDPHDPAATDPALYKVLFENARVRVLEYRDEPGDHTNVHRHPDSVMIPLGDFRRRVTSGGRSVEVDVRAGEVRWLDAQEHAGENIGDTASYSVFVELKEPAPVTTPVVEAPLGPAAL
ncbi:cytoplasmic protein [Actinoplanes solisilvae]|uniref:cytoplasmic protein n=1 Tax=Actinoplanes solisilvae TaxID=2486853 RepID=UPI000FDBD6FF|nr:cytoplasmic protein [Actinoplanes solisilvae]